MAFATAWNPGQLDAQLLTLSPKSELERLLILRSCFSVFPAVPTWVWRVLLKACTVYLLFIFEYIC